MKISALKRISAVKTTRNYVPLVRLSTYSVVNIVSSAPEEKLWRSFRALHQKQVLIDLAKGGQGVVHTPLFQMLL